MKRYSILVLFAALFMSTVLNAQPIAQYGSMAKIQFDPETRELIIELTDTTEPAVLSIATAAGKPIVTEVLRKKRNKIAVPDLPNQKLKIMLEVGGRQFTEPLTTGLDQATPVRTFPL